MLLYTNRHQNRTTKVVLEAAPNIDVDDIKIIEDDIKTNYGSSSEKCCTNEGATWYV